VSAEQYRTRLQQAKDANMQMVRVWGGGVYEADAFYDLCDQLGLLVWQDFMFACGEYPAFPEFVESVRLEAEAQVKRLRHHPSLALWCGNNEDYQYESHAGKYNPDLAPDNDTVFRARVIYEKVLAEVCGQLDPARLYWPGSPYGGHDPDDPTQGDRHTWEVWHRGMAPYQTYDNFRGRFVSEFGMQGAPALSTIRRAIPEAEQHPSSRTFEHHNKAAGGHRHLAVYISDNLALPDGLEAYVYATQFIQAEALGYAYREWRRRFGVAGKRDVAGALVWQLNDCWPVQSWAVIDSSGIPKPAYSAIARELAPIAIGVRRGLEGYRQNDWVELWAVNGRAQRWGGALEIKLYDLYGLVDQEQRPVVLEAGGVTELSSFKLHHPHLIVSARLLDDQGVQARASAWPEPFKYLHQPDPGLQIAASQDGVRLRVQHPLKGLHLEVKGIHLEADGITFEDNHIDLFPGEERLVRAKGLGGKTVQARYLQSGMGRVWQPKPEGEIGEGRS
jgi:beta-mannosidase